MIATATKNWCAPDRLPAGLRYAERDGIATITLARPERLNALTFDIYAALRDVFAQLRTRGSVRCIVLTGEGRGFCSGGDVDDIIAPLLRKKPAEMGRFTKLTCDVIANMRACPQPIIAALNGVVAGAGAALAIASDFRLAVHEAKISFLFVKVGLSGADMGATLLLPRLVGLGRATELLMLGDALPAADAERIGLYHRLVPSTELEAETLALGKRLAAGPRRGLAVTKASLDRELGMGLDEALAYEARVQAKCMQDSDFSEAHRAYKERRKPVFR